jgi:hypothetical protein
MTQYSLDAAMRAFEERFSISQNQLKQEPLINTRPWERIKAIRPQHRATDFENATPIPEGMYPSLPVQLVATTQLALHLCKRKTPPYRVRREQLGSNPMHANLYVPRTDWEFHFDALRLLTTERKLPSALLRTNVLHPATHALINISSDIHARDLMPHLQSYEERQVLETEQSQRNLIAQEMSKWYALPNNERSMKSWVSKHLASEKAFLNAWTAEAKKRECFLLRVDLIYSAVAHEAWGFCAPSHSVVRRNVATFLDAVRCDPVFTDATWMLTPYADLSNQWQLPLIALIPGSDRNRPQVHLHLQNVWDAVAGVKGESLKFNLPYFQGHYRFVSEDQAIFGSLDQQLLYAANYLFGTRMIADTCIDTVSTAIDINIS